MLYPYRSHQVRRDIQPKYAKESNSVAIAIGGRSEEYFDSITYLDEEPPFGSHTLCQRDFQSILST